MAREPHQIAELRRELGERLSAFRKAAGLTQGEFGRLTHRDRSSVSHIENGRAQADERFWRLADDRFGARGSLFAAFEELETARRDHAEHAKSRERRECRAKVESLGPLRTQPWAPPESRDLDRVDDELAALELARRVEASDVGDSTLTALEHTFDELAMSYCNTPPAVLLERLRTHLAYVERLLDARATLAQHRRLLVVGGWLSLLAATVHIDLEHTAAATARLRTAVALAEQVGHDEIRAWSYETEAWRMLTDGDYRRALELSRRARHAAPPGSSIAIQATAQEGRALARLGQRRETYRAIERVHELVSPRKRPDQPEHHYRYDPNKSVSYTATTLAWAGDPAAEEYAREVIARLSPSEDVGRWPRRVAAANLDLALALVAADRPDEACDATRRALLSGKVVPSNRWRAAEVIHAVEAHGLPEVTEVRELYEETRRPLTDPL
ncbi:transcriptional regulator with XRE-family HTH domain [Saccharomonospora amisosensis]|uniref:Transcriptional regulator with XRE-family HTH domain n=1 Tax=Saccharomonospora amisosensis TaxID=1128677 RepID=A0A7X5ZRL0_9PSEU|nr:helix-turn-helix transcriptional regulator [Saccharomonospora amisosensis]NIJ12957.1 transcriptional regulator with XRE-family HTH domain [Saccharomonospora amisosensis]